MSMKLAADNVGDMLALGCLGNVFLAQSQEVTVKIGTQSVLVEGVKVSHKYSG